MNKSVVLQHLAAHTRQWLREPLVRFLIAGGLIFGVYHFVNPPSSSTASANQIVLTKDDLRQLAVMWIAQGRASPSVEEMNSLVEQRLQEEILSREAIALGLDKNDEIIKRRLAQKMDFLAADVAALQEPSEAELRTWFGENGERFALPPRVSFRHLYFSFDRGPGAQAVAAAALPKIAGLSAEQAAAAGAADRFMLRDYYSDRTPDQIAREFGPEFAKSLFQLKAGTWQGPVRSGYGWHLVLIESTEAGRIPAFEEIQSDIKSAWLDEKQLEFKQAAFEAMRARYAITVAPIDASEWADLRLPQGAFSAADAIPR